MVYLVWCSESEFMFCYCTLIHYMLLFMVANKADSCVKSCDSHTDQWSYLPPSYGLHSTQRGGKFA